MGLACEKTSLPEVLLFTPKVHGDSRGFFLQTYQTREYAAAGLDCVFVQDNLSRSRQDTVRGLHYQLKHPQGKLVSVLRGAVLDVAVDIRRGSPTFGKYVIVELSEENRRQLFIPEGFAHGFRVLTDIADFHYKCTDFYAPGDEYGILWNDPSLAIPWDDPAAPVVSPKDQLLPRLAEVSPDNLPEFTKLKDVGLQ
ncbi:MAG: dTDP-4-dehydrorhamnose 3,5-epimerase [Kiritimatiellae bacterium]|jgi:dTDP-4-dehydrorhamnose 3,5-epimerase|nr:dTDP-4-dehydrorhamnose 3,5-epimerase [Kiritimatiellia bacterium]HOU21111.1 dTDP-4-dehydrorhamnose 3,5-epimerase [Kiritimatiellia bacterium]HPC19095.1 dTDP-4-dehydrorhamnose 3,5-epimerase [Kiritimatiellia bacterium]HQN79840.1 dTDP-4-dehydrorhamnose 3,5-epimerase [Kiritimatiellia bacterium]HQQ60003.1 dTDP-4-dehydrorhamnose 3,5-epimerase [Kiritimatiellia bacterium]